MARLFFVALFVFGYTTQAAALTLESPSLSLQVDAQSATVTQWQLRGVGKTAGKHQVPVDLAAPAGRLFALEGVVAGRRLSEWERIAGGWKVTAQTPAALTLTLEHPGLPVVFRKHWQLSPAAWRARFELEIEPRPPEADLRDVRLVLNPGLGTPRAAAGAGASQQPAAVYGSAHEVHIRHGDAALVTGLVPDPSQALDWVGLHSRYFAFLLVPADANAKGAANAATLAEGGPVHQAALRFPAATAKPGATQRLAWTVFGGPKSYAALQPQAAGDPDFRGLLFGDLWSGMQLLCLALMHTLDWLEAVTADWGLAILLLAALVRIALWPVARKTAQTQAKLRAVEAQIGPELRAIRNTYRGAEQSERILALYAKHGTSPLAALKPLVLVALQFPVFIALYHVLGRSYALRDAGFLWIDSLGAPDRLFSFGTTLPYFGAYFNGLPVLMAALTFWSISVSGKGVQSPGTGAGLQLGLIAMTIGFFVLFYNFPSGMVLYWTAANGFQLLTALWSKHDRPVAGAAELPVGG